MFSYMNYRTILVAKGTVNGMLWWDIPIFIGLTMFVMVYYIRKMYALK